ncbi:MAG: DUF4011 domain-containing protein [Clostridiales bacterium]|nr:DUF4011 domain-containing protein [Clostridiales bacterium]
MDDQELQVLRDKKFDMWERKLLDLSLRNNLLNTKPSQMIRLFAADPAVMEDRLNSEKDYKICPLSDIGLEEKSYDLDKGPEDPENKIAQEFESDKIFTDMTRGSLDDKIKDMHRKSKIFEDENGASSLYLATCFLKWRAKDSDTGTWTKFGAKAKTEVETEEESKTETEVVAEAVPETQTETVAEDVTDPQTEVVSEEVTEPKTEERSDAEAESETEKDANAEVAEAEEKTKTEKETKPDNKGKICYAPILLIPCEITRKSIVLGYKVRRRDEDTLLNISLVEKMRQDFGIEIPVFAEGLPHDESGVDVNAVKDAVKAAISGMDGWEVVDTVMLGLFSFNTFVMWNDIHKFRDQLMDSSCIRSLVANAVDDEILDAQNRPIEDGEPLLPLPADDSQIEAVKAATAGRTFVLHGPPGTGKSQTITSIIADGIANGKKILFVAEKKVALDVVYSRLEKIGIAPFCLELHSNKAKKSHVLEQIRVASEVAATSKKKASEYEAKLDELTKRRKELDGYVFALHDRQPSGYTVYELINLYTRYKDAPDVDPFPDGFFDDLTESDISKIESLLGQLASMPMPAGQNLSFIHTTEYSQSMRDEVPALATACKERSRSLTDSEGKVRADASSCGVVLPDELDRVVKDCMDLAAVPSYYLTGDNLEKNVNDVLSMCDVYADAFARKEELCLRWSDDFLTRDAGKLKEEFDDAQGKIAPLRSMAVSSLYKKLSASDKTGGAVKDNLREEFDKLASYQQVFAKAEGLHDQFGPQIPKIDSAAAGSQLKSEAEGVMSLIGRVGYIQGITGYAKRLAGDETCRSNASKYLSDKDAYAASYEAVKNLLKLTDDGDSLSQEEKDARMDVILSSADDLRNIVLFNQSCANAKGEGVANIVNAYAEGKITKDELVPSFMKRVARDLTIRYIDANETLRSFSSSVFEEKVRQFAAADDEFIKVTKEEIYLRLCKNLPDLAQEANAKSVMGYLQRAIRSHGRNIPIRGLFSEVSDLITKLCPCMLMSPISVAQYLEPGKVMFDTVIFDEASQIPTAEAIGVLARGKSAVIVGDPNQMPPTTFFQAMQTDYGEFEVEDMESILDDCLASGITSMYLAWHYRSRHESLIAFSNRCFYDGKLFTFPSADNKTKKVEFINDQSGTFDRGKSRTNLEEAKAVVKFIRSQFDSEPTKPCSIGVVTFNIQQQYKIIDLLDEECSKDSKFEEWLYGSEDPILVKNLENVQGDERDTIIFSITYGPDKDGNKYMNFGPLNNDGGWRRLNVAVTRARCCMLVYSALRPDDIKITDSSSDGVIAFKRFLEYASGNELWDENIVSAAYSEINNPLIDRTASYKDIAEEIASRLEKEGYSCDTFIGRSSFKIDIGVADKEMPDVYKLGILLDGPSYCASKATSAREVSQPSLLKGLGWKLLRVRLIEWWESPDRVMEEIISALNEVDEVPVSEDSEKAEGTTAVNDETVADTTEVAEDSEIINGAAETTTVYADNALETAEEPIVVDNNYSWDCECGAKGNNRKFCSECGKPRPVVDAETDSIPEDLEGDDVKKN